MLINYTISTKLGCYRNHGVCIVGMHRTIFYSISKVIDRYKNAGFIGCKVGYYVRLQC